MSVKRLNYLSIPVGKRRLMAKQARHQIRQAMNNNPAISDEDAAKYNERLDKLGKWESGTLEGALEPSTHMVNVSETVSVSESGG